jgi:hypothetical protein
LCLIHLCFMQLPGKVHQYQFLLMTLELVGGHSSGHLVPTFTNYNFTGQAVALPICLGNLPYFLPLTPIWKSALLWNGAQFLDKKLEVFSFNATESYNATQWPHIPRCHDKCNPWCPHKGASWEQCISASPMPINVTEYKLVYWS